MTPNGLNTDPPGAVRSDVWLTLSGWIWTVYLGSAGALVLWWLW